MNDRDYLQLLGNEDHLRLLIAHYLITNELTASALERLAGDYPDDPDYLAKVLARLKSEIA
jgi:hypothetical protein